MPQQPGQLDYFSQDTIAAIATALGGAIAILRVSGPLSFDLLVQMTHRPDLALCPERQLIPATLYVKEQRLDHALIVRFPRPRSFTGEDLVEFHLHGNPWIAHTLLQELILQGARQALPGEFSFRSVREGKQSLFQAQALLDLMQAPHTGATDLAIEKMSGQNLNLESLAETLRSLTCTVEINLDFSDQEIPSLTLLELQQQLKKPLQQLQTWYQDSQRGIRIQKGVQLAFVGLPNAGKSSLFNALLKENRSIVSEIPGTTRDIVTESIILQSAQRSLQVHFQDTAGLRSTKDPLEQQGILKSFETVQKADLILFLVDLQTIETFKNNLLEQWNQMHHFCPQSSLKTLVVFTKADLYSTTDFSKPLEFLRLLGLSQWIKTSAHEHQGFEDLTQAIFDFTEDSLVPSSDLVLTRFDHQQAVKEAIEHLQRAQTTSQWECFAADLHQALFCLRSLIGETLPEDLLRKIFSDFCIGK